MGERRKTPCHWPWSGMVISWDGGVAPCSIIDDENSDFGNVFENDIIYKSQNICFRYKYKIY